MMSNNKLILISIFACSFLSLAIAYFSQYILGHEPCNLCLIERIPYLASLILIPLIFIINKFIDNSPLKPSIKFAPLITNKKHSKTKIDEKKFCSIKNLVFN